MTILVTGGAGYIGSHAVLVLLQAGYQVVVLDNYSNSSPEALRRVEGITGSQVQAIRGDIRDEALLKQIFARQSIDAVMHFAGLKAVGESMSQPLAYYDNNVHGTVKLFQAMADAGIKTLIFSSSATVYGDPQTVPVHEEMPLGHPANPYGRTKLMIEQMLKDLAQADEAWSVGLLRYFNPVGAHDSGSIGEDPQGVPNNLLPFISQVAVGKRSQVTVFGDDYPTPDGTGVRDYIHVMDLVQGHLQALERLQASPGLGIWNLGTGQGYSVLEMIQAFERISGQAIPYAIGPRRDGDIAAVWADPSRAAAELKWQAQRGLEDMVADTWRWQRLNPAGYAG